MSEVVVKKHIEAKVKVLEAKKKYIKDNLPHLYGSKFYQWQRNFFDAKQQFCFLTAANQVGKSTIQIRRMIHWATSPNLWPKLWPKNPHPRVFWYLYPSDEMAISEWKNKWLPEFMPRGEMKDHPQFGWTVDATTREIRSITFNTGVTIQFKTYGQKSSNLQGTTVHAIGFDEELPFEHYAEVTNRLNATDGYLSGVFTPTLNQEFWFRVMEGKGDNELLQEAVKFQVSLYDCLHYEDGSPSTVWTLDKIEKVKNRCGSETEVQRRVYGRFVTEEGRKYPSFDPNVHYVKPFQLRSDTLNYVGVDIGSGGAKSHPAAMIFIAVQTDFKKGWVYKGWRGDGIDTTSSDILDKYRELRGKDNITMAVFDGAAKDFGTLAGRLGEPFTTANKKVGDGVDLINALFKNNMLQLFNDPELTKLGGELMSLMHGQNKSTAKDDFTDSLRYALMSIPWDFSDVAKNVLVEGGKRDEKRPWTDQELAEMDLKDRRGELDDKREGAWQDFEADIDYWNGLSGNGG